MQPIVRSRVPYIGLLITHFPFSQFEDLRVSLNPIVPNLPEPCPMQRIGPMPERHCFPLPNFSFHWIHPKPQQGRGCVGQCNGCIFLDCTRRPPSAASVRLVIQRRFTNHLPVPRSLTAGNIDPPKELAGVKSAYGGLYEKVRGVRGHASLRSLGLRAQVCSWQPDEDGGREQPKVSNPLLAPLWSS